MASRKDWCDDKQFSNIFSQKNIVNKFFSVNACCNVCLASNFLDLPTIVVYTLTNVLTQLTALRCLYTAKHITLFDKIHAFVEMRGCDKRLGGF